jgi:hypothetical protein
MKLLEWAKSERLRRAFHWVGDEFQFEDNEKYKAERKSSFEVGGYPYDVTAF